MVKNSQPEPEEQLNHDPGVEVLCFHKSGKKRQCGEEGGPFCGEGVKVPSERSKWGRGHSSFPLEEVAHELRLSTRIVGS